MYLLNMYNNHAKIWITVKLLYIIKIVILNCILKVILSYIVFMLLMMKTGLYIYTYTYINMNYSI